jgi:spore coat protein CotH
MVKLIWIFLLLTGCSLVPNSSGDNDFEIPTVSIEMRDEDYYSLRNESIVNEWIGIVLTEESVQKTATLRRHGDTSRKDWKGSYKLNIFDKYWLYSAEFKDHSFLRYPLATFLFKKSGITVAQVKPLFLEINSNKEGLYLNRETINSEFYSSHSLNAVSIYSLRSKSVFTLENGQNIESSFKKRYPEESMNYAGITELVKVIDEVRESHEWSKLENILDIDNALRYYAVSSLISHWDGIDKNCYIWRNGATGKFALTPWDLNYTFDKNRLLGDTLSTYSNGLVELLVENPVYRQRVKEIQLNIWNSEELLDTLNSYEQDISLAYNKDPYLSALNFNLSDEVETIREYIGEIDRLWN